MTFVEDLQSEVILNSANRKLPLKVKPKRLNYARQNADQRRRSASCIYELEGTVAVPADVLLRVNRNSDTAMWTTK